MGYFCIVDIETTGSAAVVDRITEVAVVVTDGQSVVETYQSLLNPGRSIPPYVSLLTGITDTMVRSAPRFEEVAARLVKLLEGRVFVAHNVSFDYQRIVDEFARLGYRFETECLCTLKLTRRVFPGLESYSLGPLAQALQVSIEDRHRAMGDCSATAEIFHQVLHELELSPTDFASDTPSALNTRQVVVRRLDERFPSQTATPTTTKVARRLQELPFELVPGIVESLEQAPDSPGVYYFLDAQAQPLYIGKSNRIQHRLCEHLADWKKENSKLELWKATQLLTWQLTGSDLLAQLIEADEIKRHRPRFNVAQKQVQFPVGLFALPCRHGYQELLVTSKQSRKLPDGAVLLREFVSIKKAQGWLDQFVQTHTLCRKFTGLEKGAGACSRRHMRGCLGACTGLEPADTYNARVQAAVSRLILPWTELAIETPGTHEGERILIRASAQQRAWGWKTCPNNLDFQKNPKAFASDIPLKPLTPDQARILHVYWNGLSPEEQAYYTFLPGPEVSTDVTYTEPNT
jgi:DNA polymerase-3 subunit epsilon